MDQELLTDHLYLIGYGHYYELEEAQKGKAWYIPPQDAFPKYTDSYYVVHFLPGSALYQFPIPLPDKLPDLIQCQVR